MSMLLLIVLTLLYTCFIVILYGAWKRIAFYPISGSPGSVSVVVAFRNEEKHLPALLKALSQQVYPAEKLELILVNDHSEDESVKKVSAFQSPFNLRLIELPSGSAGKKKALTAGIAMAQGDWILTTDADCMMGEYWVQTMLSHAQSSGARLVFGPVMYRYRKGWSVDVQSIELSSLIGSGAALWQMGYPTMCNGANLLYRKELVYGEDVYRKNDHLASGDDEFLMHEVFKANPKDVSFVKNKESLVQTEASSSWVEFYQQRKRWASKWGAYRLVHVKLIAFGVFSLNFCYAFLPFLLLCTEKLMPWILIAYLVRWFFDGIFLKEIICFYDKPFNLVSYVGVALLYPYYVLLSALAGRWGKYNWKGRTVR